MLLLEWSSSRPCVLREAPQYRRLELGRVEIVLIRLVALHALIGAYVVGIGRLHATLVCTLSLNVGSPALRGTAPQNKHGGEQWHEYEIRHAHSKTLPRIKLPRYPLPPAWAQGRQR